VNGRKDGQLIMAPTYSPANLKRVNNEQMKRVKAQGN
jgi:hypothetical protein